MAKADVSRFCLVSVVDTAENCAGFGVYIGDGLVLTCAHVLQEIEGGPVSGDLRVRFETSQVALPIEIVEAVPPVVDDNGIWISGDAALLRIKGIVPNGARAAPLVTTPRPNEWLVFGRPKDNPKLTEINGVFKTSSPLPELRGRKDEDIAIEPGFSGTPVFDEVGDQVFGLVRSGIRRWGTFGKEKPVRQSYMLPTETIVAELKCGELETRISNRFVRLSTSVNREEHHRKLIKRVREEWKALGIELTFDYRISALPDLQSIRDVHRQSAMDCYPEPTPRAFWCTSDFLRDLTREDRNLDSTIFHFGAPGGSGKSVFARDTVQKALDHLVVPYCIDLKKSQKSLGGSGDKEEYDVEDLFKGTVAGGSKLLLDDLGAERLCLLFADGLNETASAAAKWLALLQQLSENHPNLRIVICDRIVDRGSDFQNSQLMTILPLSKGAINQQITKASGPSVDDMKLLDLLSTPFFLHLHLPSGLAGRPAGVQGNTRTEMFEDYFRMALGIASAEEGSNPSELHSALELLSDVAYCSYAKDDHLFLDSSSWRDGELPEFKRKLEQSGTLQEIKQSNQKIGFSFRHQLLHDYLVGYHLAKHTPPDYGSLHAATWRSDNPEPLTFALELIGTAGADDFLNQVYDWNYSITIGCLRDMEESRQATVSDFFKAAVAALIALKTADHFLETRRAGEHDLRIFEKGLTGHWRDAVLGQNLNDDTKIANLLASVRKEFDLSLLSGAGVVDFELWKNLFCRSERPNRGDERYLFVNNPLIGWTAANSFRRTGYDSWFLDSVKGAYQALRETGISSTDGSYLPVARVARRRIAHVLGIAEDENTVELLESVVLLDAKEDQDVKNDALRSLLEIASKIPRWRERIIGRVIEKMPSFTPEMRRRVLKSHRVIKEDAGWLARVKELVDLGSQLESDERHKAKWEHAKDELRAVATQ